MQHPPDGLTKGIRFGCGAILGLAVGLGVVVRSLPMDRLLGVLLVALPALIFGILAMKWGDAFWEWFRDHFWWFS